MWTLPKRHTHTTCLLHYTLLTSYAIASHRKRPQLSAFRGLSDQGATSSSWETPSHNKSTMGWLFPRWQVSTTGHPLPRVNTSATRISQLRKLECRALVLLLHEFLRYDKSTMDWLFPRWHVSITYHLLLPFSGCLLLCHLSTMWSPPNRCATCSHEPSVLGTSWLLQSKRNSFKFQTPNRW
jgi:hypothetical protein